LYSNKLTINYIATYEIIKGIKGVIAFLSTIVSVILFLYGFQLTPVFQGMGGSWSAVYAGGAFTAPLFYWLITLYFPNICCCFQKCRKERDERREMHRLRKERKTPSLFNDMVKEAEERAKPPIKRIIIVAKMYLSYYRVKVATLEEFQIELAKLTGLEPHRQLIKLKGKEIHFPELRLDDGYGMNEYDELEVFNKGGYLTPYKTRDGHVHHDFEKGILKPKPKDDEASIDDSTIITESTKGGNSFRKSSKGGDSLSKKSMSISSQSTKKTSQTLSGLTTTATTSMKSMKKAQPDDASVITMQTKV